VNDGIDAFKGWGYVVDAIANIDDGRWKALYLASAKRGNFVVLSEFSTGEAADESTHTGNENFPGFRQYWLGVFFWG